MAAILDLVNFRIYKELEMLAKLEMQSLFF